MTKRPSLDGEPITAMLRAWKAGDDDSRERVIEMLYPQLRAQAARVLNQSDQQGTLNPTALVNETFLSLQQHAFDTPNRYAFRALVGTAMRRVLLMYARDKQAQKRGGNAIVITLNDISGRIESFPIERFLDLNRLFETMHQRDPRRYRICEGRYFAGLTIPELALMEGVSEATITRELRSARAWLKAKLDHD